jgi:hypothetical protein
MERITVLYGCSMRGEKLPTMYIGKSKNPRSFKDFNLNASQIIYASNKSALVTEQIFNQWLVRINDKMKIQDRTILLSLIIAPHKIKKPQIQSNLKLQYLPPNTSALIQLLDMGFIRVRTDINIK